MSFTATAGLELSSPPELLALPKSVRPLPTVAFLEPRAHAELKRAGCDDQCCVLKMEAELVKWSTRRHTSQHQERNLGSW